MPKKKLAAPSDTDEVFDFDSLEAELAGLATSSGHDDSSNDLRGFISTGCFVLDAEIGKGLAVGGYPMGRFTEVFGAEGVGKTTLATAAMIACQQGRGCTLIWEEEIVDGRLQILPKVKDTKLRPGLPILIDSEFKWSLDRAQEMGLNPKQMRRINQRIDKKTGEPVPLSLEYCLEELEKVLDRVKANPYFKRSDVPVLVVWDSLAASPIEVELQGDGLQEGIASKARKVRAAMRRMTGLLANLNVTVLVVNQVYDRIGIPGVEASGGRGLKFHSSHRMQIKKDFQGGILAEGMKPVGIQIKVKAVKSSICPPTHDVAIPIRFTTGIDDDRALMDFFTAKGRKIENNPITISGAWMKAALPDVADPISFQYRTLREKFAEYPQFREYLQQVAMKHIRG